MSEHGTIDTSEPVEGHDDEPHVVPPDEPVALDAGSTDEPDPEASGFAEATPHAAPDAPDESVDPDDSHNPFFATDPVDTDPVDTDPVDTDDSVDEPVVADEPDEPAEPVVAAGAERLATPAPGSRDALIADAEALKARWQAVQVGFVDEPRQAVQDADRLVTDVIDLLVQAFGDQRGQLEAAWGSGDDVSTEDLRLALHRYRAFFERLLSA